MMCPDLPCLQATDALQRYKALCPSVSADKLRLSSKLLVKTSLAASKDGTAAGQSHVWWCACDKSERAQPETAPVTGPGELSCEFSAQTSVLWIESATGCDVYSGIKMCVESARETANQAFHTGGRHVFYDGFYWPHEVWSCNAVKP